MDMEGPSISKVSDELARLSLREAVRSASGCDIYRLAGSPLQWTNDDLKALRCSFHELSLEQLPPVPFHPVPDTMDEEEAVRLGRVMQLSPLRPARATAMALLLENLGMEYLCWKFWPNLGAATPCGFRDGRPRHALDTGNAQQTTGFPATSFPKPAVTEVIRHHINSETSPSWTRILQVLRCSIENFGDAEFADSQPEDENNAMSPRRAKELALFIAFSQFRPAKIDPHCEMFQSPLQKERPFLVGHVDYFAIMKSRNANLAMIKQVTKEQMLHDPYIAGLLIALAEKRRHAQLGIHEKGPHKVHLLLRHLHDNSKMRIYIATVTNKFLNKLKLSSHAPQGDPEET
ncbi:hypothetical protein CMUS01_10600 [Colletotrichum musicola]|uniref:Uncharacterized protein n=1 Tax=Colletotrichum musicola TaxID=2175873 RepID=A0A8H6K1Y2_9PEZI|nr:hypothetical protein CMUS01_10600 [Colletotrichum musicola]